jgi:hypothetical protein
LCVVHGTQEHVNTLSICLCVIVAHDVVSVITTDQHSWWNRFNLGTVKAKVMKFLDDHISAQFRRFYASQLFDRLLQVRLRQVD